MRRTILFAIIACLVPLAALAQQPVGSLAALRARLGPHASVVVTDREGQQIKGRVSQVSADALELTVRDAARRFAEDEIALVEQRRNDNVLNGAAIGAGVSGGLTLVLLSIFCDWGCNGAGQILLSYSIVGAVIGLGVDAGVRPLRPIYVAGLRAPATKPTVGLSPILGRGAAGAAVNLRF